MADNEPIIVPLPRDTLSPEVTRDVSTMEAITSINELENVIVNTADFIMQKNASMEPEDDYDWNDYNIPGYEDQFKNTRSSKEAEFLADRIRRKQRADEDFASATGWQKALGLGTLIASDPSAWMGPSAALMAGRSSMSLARTGLTFGAMQAEIETGREFLLTEMQPDRTFEESISNVAAATTITGLLGTSVAAYNRGQIENLATTFAKDLRGNREYVVDPDSGDISLIDSSAGAQQVTPEMGGFDDLEISGLDKTKVFNEYSPGFVRSPTLDLGSSPFTASRQYNEETANLGGLIKEKDKVGGAQVQSVELEIQDTLDNLNMRRETAKQDAWSSYMKRVKEAKSKGEPIPHAHLASSKSGILKQQEFFSMSVEAAIRGDVHEVPEIAKFAKQERALRREVAEMGKIVDEEGKSFFKGLDLDSEAAQKHINIIYDTHKIRQLEDADGSVSKKLKQIITRERDVDLPVRKQELEAEIKTLKGEENAKVRKEKRAEIRKIEKRMSRMDEEIDDLVAILIENLTRANDGRVPYDRVKQMTQYGKGIEGKRGSAKGRTFSKEIEPKELEEFIIKDADALFQTYIRTLVPDIALYNRFKTLDFDTLKARIAEDMRAEKSRLKSVLEQDKKLKADDPKKLPKDKREKLEKRVSRMTLDRQERDMKNMRYFWERLRGTYAKPDDYAAPRHVLERSAMALNFATMLNDLLLSSIPDVARPAMALGVQKAFGDLFSAMAEDMGEVVKLGKQVGQEYATILDMTNATTVMSRFNIDEYVPTTSKIDRYSQGGAELVSHLTISNMWNSVMRTYAGITSQHNFLKTIDKAVSGKKLTQKEITALGSHGINKDMYKTIHEQWVKHGDKINKKVYVANINDWDKEAKIAMLTFRRAVRKQVDELILRPGMEVPALWHRPGWKMIGQFKSFPLSAQQRMLYAGIQQADLATLNGALISIFLGANVYMAKSALAGREINTDPIKLIIEGIDRSGAVGWSLEANNMIEKITRGRVGINGLLGTPPMSRYASRNAIGSMMGPTFGQAVTIMGVIGDLSVGEVDEKTIENLRGLVPLNKAPGFRQIIFDPLEESMTKQVRQ